MPWSYHKQNFVLACYVCWEYFFISTIIFLLPSCHLYWCFHMGCFFIHFTPPTNPHFIVPTSQSLMPFVPPPSLAIHHALDSPSWTKSSTIVLMASKASISTPSIDGDASTSCSIVLPMRTHPMITRSQNNIDKSKQLFQATENPSQNQWNHICYLSP